MRNGEHYNDPTPARSMRAKPKRRTQVLHEGAIEKMDAHRPKIPTLAGWSEEEEQKALVAWAKAQACKYRCLYWLLHIPNGGSRNIAEAVNLKKMGVQPGVPDLLLPWPAGGYGGLWIELKSESGKPTARQIDWIRYLRAAGYCAYVCVGFESGRSLILDYLEGRVKQKEDITW